MKRLILNLLFLVPLSLYGQSNVYQPVLGKNNTEWNLLHCSNGGCVTDEMFAVDDTLVNGHHWKFMNGFHFHKKLLIREDTTTRKIYFYPLIGLYKEQELLAYDFTLEAGDSMHLYNPLSPVADSAGVFVVDSTAYHEVLSTKRKFIYLRTTDQSSDEYGNPVWVEVQVHCQ